MKRLKMFISLLLCITMVFSLIGCSATNTNVPSETEKSENPDDVKTEETSKGIFKSGIYEGTARGVKGNISVHVTVDDNSIVSVKAIKNEDTPVISDAAIDHLSKEIVEKQTINLDAVSGATFSSMAVRSAVKEALLKATDDISKFEVKPAAKEKVKRADEEVDVVIVGAGGSGLTAGISISYNNFKPEKADLNVVILEKQALAGGSTMLAGGAYAVPDGLPANDYHDIHTSSEDIIHMLESRAEMELNRGLISKIVNLAPDTATKLVELGGPFSTGFATNIRTYHDVPYIQVWPYVDYKVDENGKEKSKDNKGATALTNFLVSTAQRSGAEIRLNSKAEELIIEDGKVVGVSVTDKDSTYNIYAKKVILASGGFAQNPELIEKYTPGDIGVVPYASGGSDGDGFIMAEDVDAVPIGKGAIGYPGIDSKLGIGGDLPALTWIADAIHINKEGKRFMKEPGRDLNIQYDQLLKQTDEMAFGIIDSNHLYVGLMEKSIEAANGYKADTLEELAVMIGVSADEMVKTIEEYNKIYAEGKNAEFDTPNDRMTPVLEAPFYAFKIYPIAIGTLVGLKVTENCEVLNSNGDVVPNLYAVGEMSLGGNVLSNVYVGGWSYTNAINSGRIAGEHAKAAILSE